MERKLKIAEGVGPDVTEEVFKARLKKLNELNELFNPNIYTNSKELARVFKQNGKALATVIRSSGSIEVIFDGSREWVSYLPIIKTETTANKVRVSWHKNRGVINAKLSTGIQRFDAYGRPRNGFVLILPDGSKSSTWETLNEHLYAIDGEGNTVLRINIFKEQNPNNIILAALVYKRLITSVTEYANSKHFRPPYR